MINPFDTASGEVNGTAVHSLDTANMEERTEHAGRTDLKTVEKGAQYILESKINSNAIEK